MHTIIKNIKIDSIASWLPPTTLEMSVLASEYGEKEVENIIKTTGIERVRIADNTITSADMCVYAAEHLIEQEQIDRSTLDGVVFVSQTADYILPATSITIQHRLGLGKETVCQDVHYGCSGYIYGLFQAALWISSGACKNVLVLAGDTTSRMINPQDRSLRMVFGECGTATLVTAGNDSMGVRIHSDGSGADRLIVPAGGARLPHSPSTAILEMDEDQNGRTKNDLYMDGMAIFNFAITQVHKSINTLLNEMNWEKEEIGLFALHQANEFMVNYIAKKLKIAKEKAPVNVRNYGNTGPATIPLLLSELKKEDYDYSKVILSGFGVGLSWGCIACNLTDTNFYEPVNK